MRWQHQISLTLRQRIGILLVFLLPSLPCLGVFPTPSIHASQAVPRQSRLGQLGSAGIWAAHGFVTASADVWAMQEPSLLTWRVEDRRQLPISQGDNGE